ncbi:MAG: O-antigen ligase family protein [Brachymonas sp.]|nr:O-antigen ligase family protein [Brachymonas sp.]
MSIDLMSSPRKFSWRARSVTWAAAFWGVCVVLPVGMNYLALLLLLAALLIAGRWREVLNLDRPLRPWLIAAIGFLGVHAFILAIQPIYYEETPSNLVHGIRLVLTLWVALALRGDEAAAALKAMALAGMAAALALIGLHFFFPGGAAPFFYAKVAGSGNKWIAVSVLLALLTTAAVRYAFERNRRYRWPACLAGALACFAVLVVMNQRTAFLLLAVGLGAVMLHAFRRKPQWLLAGLVSVLLAGVASWHASPQISQKFIAGVEQLKQAHAGQVSQESMVIRYEMYTQTAQMWRERPLTGWGIGSWNDQWKRRVHPILHQSNMPHNDVLWMGAQAGWLGALSWLSLFGTLLWLCWRTMTWRHQIAFAFVAMVLANAQVNSGTRDANLGLPLLFAMGAAVAWARGKAADDERALQAGWVTAKAL